MEYSMSRIWTGTGDEDSFLKLDEATKICQEVVSDYIEEVKDEDGNVGVIMKMMGYTAYVKYTKSKRGTSSQQRGLTPVFNDDVDDTRKKHKGKTLWREI